MIETLPDGIEATLNIPQASFLQMPHKFRAYVAGFGSGKTWVGCTAIAEHFWEWPGINQGYFAPTYPHIRDIFYETMEEVAFIMGLRVVINQANHEVAAYEGRKYRGTVICRSMEHPQKIVGFKIGHALIDELDVMPLIKAELAWRKIIARMRYNVPGLKNGVDVTTTPEGFKFVYQQFVKQLSEKPALRDLYGLIQASTYDNAANLPDDYIPSLRQSYPPQLINAYLRGKFVNLASGSVYPEFDRVKNHTDDSLAEGEPLHVGMDFNVLHMAAVGYVIRNGEPRAVTELTEVRDTPAMAKLLKERFKDKGHHVKIYPDASGQNTSSKNASESDLSILKAAGFQIEVNSTNPAVKDRLNSVNALILNDQGARRLKVNTRLCPAYTEALEQQPYDKNGEPDKTTGHDHVNDAGGYPLVKMFPIVKRVTRVTNLVM
ncbi:terminase family protein [Cupriavidus sp. DL-D2]|uniref:terminase large subunit domain-containing protein n=1 Tax=Cupriavidus sp. DL-D2 TaxID=3144974 RepID=UPI003213684E